MMIIAKNTYDFKVTATIDYVDLTLDTREKHRFDKIRNRINSKFGKGVLSFFVGAFEQGQYADLKACDEFRIRVFDIKDLTQLNEIVQSFSDLLTDTPRVKEIECAVDNRIIEPTLALSDKAELEARLVVDLVEHFRFPENAANHRMYNGGKPELIEPIREKLIRNIKDEGFNIAVNRKFPNKGFNGSGRKANGFGQRLNNDLYHFYDKVTDKGNPLQEEQRCVRMEVNRLVDCDVNDLFKEIGAIGKLFKLVKRKNADGDSIANALCDNVVLLHGQEHKEQWVNGNQRKLKNDYKPDADNNQRFNKAIQNLKRKFKVDTSAPWS